MPLEEKMYTMLSTLHCLILGSLVLKASGQGGPYDCHRSHSGCASPRDTCLPSGVCQCANSTYGGYDCSLDLKLVASDPDSTCDPSCGEDGICLSDNTCYCGLERLGPRCKKDRVSVECFLDHMDITIQPNAGRNNQFMGKVHIKGQNINRDDYDLSTCVRDVTSSDDAISLMYSQCGGVYNTTTPEGSEKLTFQLLVLFRHPVIQASDLVYSVSCLLHQADTPFTFTSEITFPNRTDLESKGSVDNKFNPIVLNIHEPGSDETITNVYIGQKIVLDYEFDGGEKYCDFMVVTIVASDGNGEYIKLLEDGCPVAGNDIIGNPVESPNNLKVDITTFRFVRSDIVFINSTAKLKLCSNPEKFSRLDCHVGSSGAVARRRRDVSRTGSEDAGVDVRELEATILVQFPPDSADSPVPGQTEVTTHQGEGCTNSLVLLVLCVLLGSLLILTTGSCLFFFVRMRQHTGSDVIKKPFTKMDEMRSY